MRVERDTIMQVVRSFIADRGLDASSIDVTTPLLADGWLDSFSLVELASVLETSLGLDLGTGALLPEDFESATTLWQRICEVVE